MNIHPWERIDQRGPDECWPWTGTVDKEGYGVFKTGGRQFRAARWVLTQEFPDLGADEMTRHSCDNPPCCNPGHLSRGSAADNAADMVSRGRQVHGDAHWTRCHPERLSGERNPAARLTEVNVRAIRCRYAAGEKQVRLAAEFAVTQSLISQIVRGLAWAHIEEAA